MLSKLEEIEMPALHFRVGYGILKGPDIFENNSTMMNKWFSCPSFPQTQIQNMTSNYHGILGFLWHSMDGNFDAISQWKCCFQISFLQGSVDVA